MEVRECYEEMQANYDGVFSRLRSDERIVKYLGWFLEDKNYETMKTALNEKNYKEAFMGAHNLKGLCRNLYFTVLEESASELCESLRNTEAINEEEVFALAEKTEEDYQKAAGAVRRLLTDNEG